VVKLRCVTLPVPGSFSASDQAQLLTHPHGGKGLILNELLSVDAAVAEADRTLAYRVRSAEAEGPTVRNCTVRPQISG
jgi:hypothetical protein